MVNIKLKREEITKIIKREHNRPVTMIVKALKINGFSAYVIFTERKLVETENGMIISFPDRERNGLTPTIIINEVVSTNKECDDRIKKIVEVAKDEMNRVGSASIDRIAKQYYNLLIKLDEKDAAQEVYDYYMKI